MFEYLQKVINNNNKKTNKLDTGFLVIKERGYLVYDVTHYPFSRMFSYVHNTFVFIRKTERTVLANPL